MLLDYLRKNGTIQPAPENGPVSKIEEKNSDAPMPVLDTINAHERDARIEFFEDDHKYIVDGDIDNNFTSVTTFVKSFFGKFDADEVIKKMVRSGSFARKYPGKTAEEVKEEWAQSGRNACRLGTLIHECIENDYNGVFNPSENIMQVSKEYRLFRSFYTDMKDVLEPYRFEWRIFDEDLHFAGSIDAVFKRKSDGQLVIYDWKRIKQLSVDNPWSAGNGPLSHVRDSNFYHYSLQLNMYKYLLEKNYGVHIDELAIVIFYPTMRNYLLVKLPFLQNEIQDMVRVYNKKKN